MQRLTFLIYTQRDRTRMHTLNVALMILVMYVLDLASTQEFQTDKGRVRGSRISVLGKSLDVFHGIPFAKPPVGDLRFKHPKPSDPWTGVKDATKQKPSCIQPMKTYTMFSEDKIRVPPNDTSEDCLYLSIWRPNLPSPKSKLAVMFWIYGGGFVTGTTKLPLYNGQYLAAQNDVIVVSVNYRLGPLGFAYLSPDTIPGNMGMMDQVLALKWVKDNIANFDGDPNKITLFGESAGGSSVGIHMLSPLSRDLFNNGIIQSGVPMGFAGTTIIKNKQEARAFGEQLSQAVGCSASSNIGMYNCMKGVSSDNITGSYTLLGYKGVVYNPIIDGYFITDDPTALFRRGEYKKASIINGATKDEAALLFRQIVNMSNPKLTKEKYEQVLPLYTSSVGGAKRRDAAKIFYENLHGPPVDYLQTLGDIVSDFLFKCPALFFSSLCSNHSTVFMYSADYGLSVSQFPEWVGVPHSYELELVFGVPLDDSLGFSPTDKAVSRNMMTYWTNFAKSGNPNSPVSVAVRWDQFSDEKRNYLALDAGSKLVNTQGYRRQQCAFWNRIVPSISGDESPVTAPPPVVYPCTNDGGCPCTGCILYLLYCSLFVCAMLIR